MGDRRMNRRTFVGLLAAATQVTACAGVPGTRDPFAEADRIVAGIRRTGFPARTEVVDPSRRDRDARPAVQAAIDRIHEDGGGTVVLGAGMWLSDGPVRLKSNVRLHLEEGAHLQFLPNADSYLPPVLTRWEGTEVYTYSPMVFADGEENIAITGPGRIDGQGKAHWLPWRETQGPIKKILRDMGRDGVPVEERVFVGERRLRPYFVQFRDCRRVLVDGPTFVDSPFWIIHPLYCEDVIVRNITCISHHINSDGVDPDSSRGVLIENCDFDIGDDGVAIKSGRDQDGWRVGRPSEDIVIRNCRYSGSTGGGVAIGSEMSGGVRNVYIEDYELPKANHTLYFKANLDRGGLIEDIFIRGIRGGEVKSVLVFSNAYHSYRGGTYPPLFQNVIVEDVRIDEAEIGISIQGHPDAPVRNITVRDMVMGSAEHPLKVTEAEGVVLDNVRAGGRRITLADAVPVDAKLVGH